MRFTLRSLNNELKVRGIILPKSEFDIELKSYTEDKKNWEKSKLLLHEMIEDAKKQNIQLVVLKFPEINLLEHQELYAKADNIIKSYFNQFPSVIYINGYDIFKGKSSKDFRLSKYDGHPNKDAHRKMAEYVFPMIQKIMLEQHKL